MTTSLDGWARLEGVLGERLPELLEDLAPGASEADLEALARATGLVLPPSAQALYLGHDGQRGEAAGLFFGLVFLSSQEAAEEWRRWTTLLQESPEMAAEITVTAHPEGAVEAVYAHRGWLPIASDGAGNHLAVDLAPGPKGTLGQIVVFGADEPRRYVVAASAMALVSWCADRLEDGQGAVVEDADAPGGRALRLRGATSLLDVLPSVLGIG